MLKGNKYRVLGIATDTIRKGDAVYLEDGKRICGAIGWYRIMNPLKKLGAECTVGYEVSNTPQSALEMKSKGDIWYCKMTDNTDIDHIYGAHRDFTGSKLILDLDDHPGKVNEDHPDYEEIEKRRPMRERMIRLADHVVVATEGIKTAIRDLNRYVTVIPNAIDPEIWKVKKPKKRKDGIIRIGWMSSGSHFADVPIINQAMDILLEKYPHIEFHFAGMTWENKQVGREFHHMGTIGYATFPQFYADLDIDIAIAPLKDTEFNRCKSNIKWMEAAMLEIPMVASDVEPYKSIEHGKTGYLAQNTPQFVKYLSWLIESESLRKKIGKAAKEEVLKNWTIDRFLPKYEELFTKIMEKKDITVITAITGKKDDLKPQPEYPGVEYVAFVEPGVKDGQWKTREVCDKFTAPVMNAKIHKILSHLYVDTPYIVWIDGSITLKKDPRELVNLMGKNDFAFFKHPGRDCLYEEGDACINLQKGSPKEIIGQMKEYAKNDFPTHSGLCELTAFVRKNNKEANDAFEKWWAHICRHSSRDQVAFPYVFKGKKWATIPGSIEDATTFKKASDELKKTFPGNKFFKITKHNHYE